MAIRSGEDVSYGVAEDESRVLECLWHAEDDDLVRRHRDRAYTSIVPPTDVRPLLSAPQEETLHLRVHALEHPRITDQVSAESINEVLAGDD